jgi:restriction system protein
VFRDTGEKAERLSGRLGHGRKRSSDNETRGFDACGEPFPLPCRNMTDVEIPTYRDLMYPTLVAIRQLGGSASISELEEAVPNIAHVTEEQLGVEYPEGSVKPGESKVLDRLHWARSYLKKIGGLDSSERRVWSITPKGLDFLEMEPAAADTALKKADTDVRAEIRKARAQRHVEDEDPDAVESIDWKDILLQALKSMDPAGFERLSMRLLREAGFRNVEVQGRSGDGGIDGVGVYKVSLVSFPTFFQCKRYTGSVAAGAVRDFRGAMSGRGDKGLLITTSSFAPAAKAEATRDGAPPVDLIDGDALCDLLKEYGLGVEIEERIVEDVTVNVEFFDAI